MSDSIDRRLLLSAAGLAGAAAFARLAHAGPLDPPAGPVAPTGVTLSDVAARASATAQGVAEPRTPISAQTTPSDSIFLYVIAAPGSYYLTGDITAGAAIRIQADDVTLDLCGFTLRAADAGFGAGVNVVGNRVSIRNGSIVGFQYGVYASSSRTDTVVEDLRTNCTARGVMLSNRSIARRCVCVGSSTGIETSANNSVVADCIVAGPGDVGIWANSSCIVERCHVSGVNRGIVASGQANRIVACTAVSNTGLGISAGSDALVQDCLTAFNSGGASATGVGILGGNNVAVTGCRVGSNDDAGIQISQNGFVDRCEVTANAAVGIRVGHGSRVRGCSISGHSNLGNAAIRLTGASSVVEDNYMYGNNIGVDAQNVVGNLIIRNMMFNNANPISVNFGGNWYPNIALGGVNTSTNPLNNVIA